MDDLKDQELPDFPWKKEESWMGIERLVREGCKQYFSDREHESMARDNLDIDEYEKFQSVMMESVLAALRKAFDKAWIDTPTSFQIQTAFHYEGPRFEPEPELIDAVKQYGQSVADSVMKQVGNWAKEYQHRLMMQLFEHELRRFVERGPEP
jgi:hypothetical protein